MHIKFTIIGPWQQFKFQSFLSESNIRLLAAAKQNQIFPLILDVCTLIHLFTFSWGILIVHELPSNTTR